MLFFFHGDLVPVDHLIPIYIFTKSKCSYSILALSGVYYTPTLREGAILQSPCPSVHTFVKDVSAATGRNYFIFDT
jgi:hypothetical protein